MKLNELPRDKVKYTQSYTYDEFGEIEEQPPVKIILGEVILPGPSPSLKNKDEDEDDEEDDDNEQDLIDALSLLGDCWGVFDLLLDSTKYPGLSRFISRHVQLYEELKRVSEEVLVFTSQYEDIDKCDLNG